MATVDELKEALRESLRARGTLGALKAQIRAEVFQALEEEVRCYGGKK